jgi:hypothetical protein
MAENNQENQIVEVIKKSGVEQSTAHSLELAFSPFFAEAKEWSEKAKNITVSDESETDKMLLARESRLALKQIRVNADKKRKELKEDSLRYGKAVQGIYNVIDYFIVPIEKHLQAQEDFIKVKEEQRKQEIAEKRLKEIESFIEFIPESISIKDLSDDDFQKLLAGSKMQYEEQQRIEREKELDRIEQERIRTLDYNRRREISEYAQFIPGFQDLNFGKLSDEEYESIKNKSFAAKQKYDAEQEEIRKENEILKEQQRIEAEKARKQAEKEEKERQAKQAEIDRLKKEAEQKEREERERKEKEAQLERERIEAEKEAERQRQEAEKKKLAAPDKDKLKEVIADFKNIKYPNIKTPEAIDALNSFINDVNVAISELEKAVIKL